MYLCDGGKFGKEHDCHAEEDDTHYEKCQLCDGYYAEDYDWIEIDYNEDEDECDDCGDNSKELVLRKDRYHVLVCLDGCACNDDKELRRKELREREREVFGRVFGRMLGLDGDAEKMLSIIEERGLGTFTLLPEEKNIDEWKVSFSFQVLDELMREKFRKTLCSNCDRYGYGMEYDDDNELICPDCLYI